MGKSRVLVCVAVCVAVYVAACVAVCVAVCAVGYCSNGQVTRVIESLIASKYKWTHGYARIHVCRSASRSSEYNYRSLLQNIVSFAGLLCKRDPCIQMNVYLDALRDK